MRGMGNRAEVAVTSRVATDREPDVAVGSVRDPEGLRPWEALELRIGSDVKEVGGIGWYCPIAALA